MTHSHGKGSADHGAAGHSHAPANYDRAFAFGIALNTVFVLIEAGFGFAANSLALVADAGHNLSDVLGLLIAWGAAVLSRRGPTARRTYGLRSSSVLAALVNAVVLLIAIGAIAYEAVDRLRNPAPVAGTTVVIVASIGIVINSLTALLFFSGRKGDLNIRGAYLHMAADAGVSVGVVVAGLAIRATGIQLIDPLVSIAIVVLILWGTWGLLRESLDLILHAVPSSIDPGAVESYLRGLPGVTEVHDLHIWGMSTTEAALTAHVIRPESRDDDAFLLEVCRALHDRFGVEHATIQVERGTGPAECRLAPAHVV